MGQGFGGGEETETETERHGKRLRELKKKMLPNLANILASISETDPMNCYF